MNFGESIEPRSSRSRRKDVMVDSFRNFFFIKQRLEIRTQVFSIFRVWSYSKQGPRHPNFDVSFSMFIIFVTYSVFVKMTVALPLSGLVITRSLSARSSFNTFRCSRLPKPVQWRGFQDLGSRTEPAASECFGGPMDTQTETRPFVDKNNLSDLTLFRHCNVT